RLPDRRQIARRPFALVAAAERLAENAGGTGRIANDRARRMKDGKVNRLISTFVAVVLAAAAAGLVLVSFAGYFGGQRYLELLADFRPYYLAAGATGLLIALTALRPGVSKRAVTAAALGFLIAVAVNGFEVVPWWTASRPSP